MLSLGIDTGGTYTDAVIVDSGTGAIKAKAKSPTTKEDLSIGIKNVIGKIPADLVAAADSVTLSTTLATNACVEDKGGRAKLLLIGTTDSVLDRIDAEQKYGLKRDSILCIDSFASYNGKTVDIPDWDALYAENKEWLDDAEALAVAETYAFNTAAVRERSAKEFFEVRLGVPIVLASEIVNEVNMMERGATALLNARLLTVIDEFIDAVRTSVSPDKHARLMIMRSDCSFMTVDKTLATPVETILSGPAASTIGGKELGMRPNCVIVDIGGTTTDVSLITEGNPKLASEGIRIGNWKTQINGVYVDTFALGGDSTFRLENGKLTLMSRRAIPISAAAQRWPSVRNEVGRFLASKMTCFDDHQEFLCLLKEPTDLSPYSEREVWLLDLLKQGPRMIGHICIDEEVHRSRIQSDRLEAEGFIVRAALTPTDAMHVAGDYDEFDAEAATSMARCFIRSFEQAEGPSLDGFSQLAYDVFCEKLYCGIARILLSDCYPGLFANGMADQTEQLLHRIWNGDGGNGIISAAFSTPYTLVGVGAPTHIFLPKVAEALGAPCSIPEHAEVANAIGAALAKIQASKKVSVVQIPQGESTNNFVVYAPQGRKEFMEFDEAADFAQMIAAQAAKDEARARGAQGEISISSGVSSKEIIAKDGGKVTFDIHAWATATESEETNARLLQ